jgi:hypothetical protein
VQLAFTLSLVPVLIGTYFTTETSEQRLRNDIPIDRQGLLAGVGLFLEHVFTRPIITLFTQPTLLALGLVSGLAISIQFSMAAAVPAILSDAYTLGSLSSALCYIGQAIGILLGSIIYLLQHSNIYRPLADCWNTAHAPTAENESKIQGRSPPRYRLLPALPATIMLPLSLAFFAFTVQPGYSIFIPLSFLVLFGSCTFLLVLSSFLHLHDLAAAENRVSSLSTFLFLANLIGAGLPIGFDHILKRLQLKGTFGVLAAGTVCSVMVVWTIWMRGKRKEVIYNKNTGS